MSADDVPAVVELLPLAPWSARGAPVRLYPSTPGAVPLVLLSGCRPVPAYGVDLTGAYRRLAARRPVGGLTRAPADALVPIRHRLLTVVPRPRPRSPVRRSGARRQRGPRRCCGRHGPTFLVQAVPPGRWPSPTRPRRPRLLAAAPALPTRRSSPGGGSGRASGVTVTPPLRSRRCRRTGGGQYRPGAA
ncbi:hypothetical protein [Streptomyces sp. NPDC091268]|uniref:hypothetical protein n=1 Tax=Streptomyces sp. NPDC091268 TaxID=3365979 RepID=UPI0037F1C7AB